MQLKNAVLLRFTICDVNATCLKARCLNHATGIITERNDINELSNELARIFEETEGRLWGKEIYVKAFTRNKF